MSAVIRELDVQERCFELHRETASANLFIQGQLLNSDCSASIDTRMLERNLRRIAENHCVFHACTIRDMQLCREDRQPGDAFTLQEVDDLDSWLTETAHQVIPFGVLHVAVSGRRYAVFASHSTCDGLSMVSLARQMFLGCPPEAEPDDWAMRVPGAASRIGFSAADATTTHGDAAGGGAPQTSTISPDAPGAPREQMRFHQRRLEVPAFRRVSGSTVGSVLLAAASLALRVGGERALIGSPQDARARLQPVVPPEAVGNFALPGGVLLTLKGDEARGVLGVAREAHAQIQESLGASFSSARPILDSFVGWKPPAPINARGPTIPLLLTNLGLVRQMPVSVFVGVTGLYDIGFFCSAATVGDTLCISVGYNSPYISDASADSFLRDLRLLLNPCSWYRPEHRVSLVEPLRRLSSSSRTSAVTYADGMRVVLRYPSSCSAAQEYSVLEAVREMQLGVRAPLPLYMERGQEFLVEEFLQGQPDLEAPDLRQMGAALRRLHDAGVVHGDFWAGNVLFDAQGTLSAVVDWEDAVISGGDTRGDLANSLLETCVIFGSPALQAFLEGYGESAEALLLLGAQMADKARRLLPLLAQYGQEYVDSGRPDLSAAVLERRCLSFLN